MLKTIKITIDTIWKPFHLVILYENYLIRIVMNINKTSKNAYWLRSKWEGGGSTLTFGAMLCPWARHIYSENSIDNTQVAMAPFQHDWN